MNESIAVSLVVSLVSLAAHVAVGAYWAGRIVGRINLSDHRLAVVETRVGHVEEALQDHQREHRAGIWGAP